MRVEIANQQSSLSIDKDRIDQLVHAVFADTHFSQVEISIAIVDDPTIHELNRKSLDHDYPTDVLSFCLEESADRLVGEVVVSADTAISNSREYGWGAEEELLLYVAHGLLHLAGYRDKADDEIRDMRRAEAVYLSRIGVTCPDDHASDFAASPDGGPNA